MTKMAKAKTTKGVSKKRGASKKGGVRPNLVPGDPPILVGGGGSVYVWVKLGQSQTPVNPSLNDVGIGIKPGAPLPTNRAQYSCSRVSRTPPRVFFFSGAGIERQLDIDDTATWYIRIM
jgi:hypothetical protein